MSWSWRREAPLLGSVIAMFVVSAVAWPFADDRIPVHWDAVGEADRFGGKLEGLMLVPLIAAGIWALLAVVPRIDPARANYASFAGSYTLVRAGVLLFMGVLHVMLVATALGAEIDVARVVYVAVGMLFVLLGAVLPKFRPNFFAGIRTPWTLSSAKSWTATHRVGGRVFIVAGIGFIAMAVAQQPWLLLAVMLATFGGIGWLMVYSYRVWRDDPDRVPATLTARSDE